MKKTLQQSQPKSHSQSGLWSRLLISEALTVVREPFFVFILLAPFLLGAALNQALPYFTLEYAESFDLKRYYPLIVALFILTPPLYYGIVLALQVLEEKGEKVLLAIAVTPITLKYYLIARVGLYTLVSIPITIIVHWQIGVIEIPWIQLALVAMAASLNTPLLVMLLAAFANNQLEGFALGKALGFLILFPLAMFFVPGYWHLLCGVLPTYWPIIAYYTAVAENGSDLFFTLAIVMGIVTQGVATVYLYRKFVSSLSKGI